MTEYAMYKGDEILYIGTLEEIAEKHGVRRETVYYYTTKSYKKKIAELYRDWETLGIVTGKQNFIEIGRAHV